MKEHEGDDGLRRMYGGGMEDKHSSSHTDGNGGPIRAGAGSGGYCESPSTTVSVICIWGGIGEISNCSDWGLKNGGTENGGDGEKPIEAEISLSISSWESKIIERLLLLLAVVVVEVVVAVVALFSWLLLNLFMSEGKGRVAVSWLLVNLLISGGKGRVVG